MSSEDTSLFSQQGVDDTQVDAIQEQNVRACYEKEMDVKEKSSQIQQTNQERLADANAYLCLYQQECNINHAYIEQRSKDINSAIESQNTYWQTNEELIYGAKVAWRNNNRCIGRFHWKSLEIRDMRHLSTANEIQDALIEHIKLSTNAGKIRSILTVFAPQQPNQRGIRIWNSQLIRYAGYTQNKNTILGDPSESEFTKIALRLGWKGGKGTPFDTLPLIIQMPEGEPMLMELPSDIILEVPISHPSYSWFVDLGLKWYAFPAISNMRLEIGGISYTAAPFSGWYVGTEIGARNFGDENRYNMLSTIAEKMELNMRSSRSLWKDQAIIETNKAVLHSFIKHGVTIVDHHTVTRQFVLHEEREKLCGRATPADWSWIVPPISGSTTPVYHRAYENIILKPNFFHQPAPWKEV